MRWCSLVASIHPPPTYQIGALPNELRERGAGWRNRTSAPCLQGRTSATKDKPAWCWRQELNPQPLAYEAFALPLCYASNPDFASPETSARVGSTGRGSAFCRGALSLKTLSFTQGISRAHAFGRERFSRT